MKKVLAITFTVAMVLVLSPVVSSAGQIVTCPNPLAGDQTRSYTVDPAIDCVWGTGKILNGGVDDDFLLGNGTNDPAYLLPTAYGPSDPFGRNFGLQWTFIGSTEDLNGSISGFEYKLATGDRSGTWKVNASQLPAYSRFALGIKDGGDPKWAVFLLDNSELAGLMSMGSTDNKDSGSFSHFVLYGVQSVPVPEPASLLLLGTGLLSAGFFRKRRK